jgi:UDP-N-acetylglucosamine 2-epimerase (non-hydrolysing)
MIDTLLKHKEKALESKILTQFGLTPKGYCLATLHRPGNVDSREVLEEIFDAFQSIGESMPVVFPCHPRTQEKLMAIDPSINKGSRKEGLNWVNQVLVCDPVGYLDFMKLMTGAKVVITDSGGIQEETTILGVPCLTVRPNTERPVTISYGTNKLIGSNKEDIIRETLVVNGGDEKVCQSPPLWDGKAAKRILDVLIGIL